MPSPISRRPAGLLDLLLTQQQGKNPTDLLDSLQPTIDLSRFYEAERLTAEKQTKNFDSVGDNGAIEIPNGEYWLVHGFAASWAWATASQDLAAHFEIRSINSIIHKFSEASLVASTGIADTAQLVYAFNTPIVFPSGSDFRFVCDSINLDGEANITTTFTTMHVRMET